MPGARRQVALHDGPPVDPVPVLFAAGDPVLTTCVHADLLGERVRFDSVWALPELGRELRGQLESGAWPWQGGRSRMRTAEDYEQIATYERLIEVVGRYRLDRRHPAVARAAEFLLGHQTAEGDIRGIYGTQYTPNYTAAILALLIEAGFADDPRVSKGLDWLMSLRQDDGGWALPLRTRRVRESTAFSRVMTMPPPPLEPDRSRPSSHLITGIVLRALVAHPAYRRRPATKAAAELLAARLLEPDLYPDRSSLDFWFKFSFPFRWTDIASALDAIGLAGVNTDAPGVMRALRWLVEHQGPDGLWRSVYEKGKAPLFHHWCTFGITRAWRRFRPAGSRRRPSHARG